MKTLVLKELADQITKVVTKIFSSSLRQQTIPDDWRSANICPVYKKAIRVKLSTFDQSPLPVFYPNKWNMSLLARS